MLELIIFAIGLILSFVIAGNNSAVALGMSISTNIARRKISYVIIMISIFLGSTLGSLTMLGSVRDLLNGNLEYLKLSIFSVLLSSLIIFYFLTRIGVPSSISQNIYPSLAVLALISKGELWVDWAKFWIAFFSWFITPLASLSFSYFLFRLLNKIHINNVITKIVFYRILILISTVFTSFIVGANALGLIISSVIIFFPTNLVVISYSISGLLGILVSRRVAMIVGFRIARLGYIGASSAIISSNVINEISTLLGIPISITQTLMGGIIGLGTRTLSLWTLKQARQIFLGWLSSPILVIILSLALFGIIRSLS
jgi:PiT family inorganic phosphate transporter